MPGREEHLVCSEEGGKREEMTRRERQRERGEVRGMTLTCVSRKVSDRRPWVICLNPLLASGR